VRGSEGHWCFCDLSLKLVGVLVWDGNGDAVSGFFLTDALSACLMAILTIFVFKKQSKADEIMAALPRCSMFDLAGLWSSFTEMDSRNTVSSRWTRLGDELNHLNGSSEDSTL